MLAQAGRGGDLVSCHLDTLAARLDSALPAGRLLVAYSGGVDSTLVLAAATGLRRAGMAEGVIADSPSLPRSELAEAGELAQRLGAPVRVVRTRELESEGYRRNEGDRCYFCKGELYGLLGGIADSEGFDAVLDGVNADDLGDHRPGLRAGAEQGVVHPLAAAGLGKAEVRALSRAWGLPTHDKPAAPCLASRLPYGERVSAEKLAMVEAAEQAVRAHGFRELRVRHHAGPRARVEVPPPELERLRALWPEIATELRALGYREAEIEPEGLRSGRLNDALSAAAIEVGA